MKCPKCGTTVKDDAKFCFACGAKLEQPKALAEPEKIEVQHVKMKPEAPKAKKKGNNKKVGKIVVAVGVCAAVVRCWRRILLCSQFLFMKMDRFWQVQVHTIIMDMNSVHLERRET